jgi:trk system potassium uptake protein
MINAKMIARIMGALFFIEAGFLILCSFLAVYYNESDISAFLYSAAITAGAGSIAALAGKNAEKRISRRDGYVIVTLAWVFFSLFVIVNPGYSLFCPHIGSQHTGRHIAAFFRHDPDK